MRTRTSVPLALSCVAVALTGCGGSNLLDSSSAQDLQESLTSVTEAVDAGECSDARRAARTGLQRVSDLPSSVDAGLRSRLRTGFEELQDRIATECKAETTTEEAPTTTETTPETTTETAPVDPAPEPTVPEQTTPQETTPEDPSTTPDDGSGDSSGGTDGSGSGSGGSDDGGGVGGEDSGGVVPGVDGPGAVERGVRDLEKRRKELRKRAEKAWRDLQKNARGQG